MAGWSQAENEFVRTHWTAGETAVAVAEGLERTFGKERTRDAVIGRIRILGLIRRKRPDLFPKPVREPKRRPPTAWDEPGALDRLAALWMEGMPVRQMAAVLSAELGLPLSSNAVIGKVHRQGLAAKHPRENNETRKRSGAQTAAATRPPRKPKPLQPSAVLALADVTNARPWLEREKGQCAYPLGEQGAILSCCASTEETYCQAHRQAMGGGIKPARDLERLARAA